MSAGRAFIRYLTQTSHADVPRRRRSQALHNQDKLLQLTRRIAVLLTAVMLTACGGGSGSNVTLQTVVPLSELFIVGDSISAYEADPGSYEYSNYLLLPDVLDNYAVPGALLVDDIAAGFNDYADQSPRADGVIIQGGVNDLIQWYSSSVSQADQLAAMQAAITTMSSAANSRGLTVIYINILPWGGFFLWTEQRQALTEDYNAWLASYAAQTGAVYVDAYSLLRATGGNTTHLAAGFDADTLHTNELGAQTLAAEVEAAIIAYRESL